MAPEKPTLIKWFCLQREKIVPVYGQEDETGASKLYDARIHVTLCAQVKGLHGLLSPYSLKCRVHRFGKWETVNPEKVPQLEHHFEIMIIDLNEERCDYFDPLSLSHVLPGPTRLSSLMGTHKLFDDARR